MFDSTLFKNRIAVLGTRHHKEKVISPIIEQNLGLKVIVPNDFNTDVFGTFTREVKRIGTQLEAARLKAEKALELTGETIALASEGTFAPHPSFPFVSYNREVVILLDKLHDIEIIGQYFSTETNHSYKIITSFQEAYDFAMSVGFPEHGLIVMIESPSQDKGDIIKGITTKEQLFEAVTFAIKKAGKAHIETDMRALYNPTRMKNIEKATHNLIQKINQVCPQCSCPGFDVIERKKGLPCAYCHLPTALTRSAIYQCKKCGFSQERLFPDGWEKADPSQCSYCNP